MITHVLFQFTEFFGFLAKNLFSRVLEASDPVVVGEVSQVHLQTNSTLIIIIIIIISIIIII